MKPDFATPIERRHPAWGCPSQKWHRYGDEVLPLWVADMDFASPPAVLEALNRDKVSSILSYLDDVDNESCCSSVAPSHQHLRYGQSCCPRWCC